LLSEEYQTLGDDDLREEYDKTMKELQNAIEIANEYV
jgi:hypothetical protein